MRAPFVASWIIACVLGAAGAVHADTLAFPFRTGSITLTATVDDELIADPVTLALDGRSVSIDPDGGVLVSIALTSSDAVDIDLDPPYAGFDRVRIESLSISAVAGDLFPVDPGPPEEFFFVVSPVAFEAVVSAEGPAGSIDSELFQTELLVASGSVFLESGRMRLTLDGVALDTIGPFGDELQPIVLKADLDFVGAIPEPTAALCFATGFATLAGTLRRSQRREGGRIQNRRR